MNDDILKEIQDRLRRIETKITKTMLGEQVTHEATTTHYEVKPAAAGWTLDTGSMNMTVGALTEALRAEAIPIGDFVDVYESQRYLFTVVVEQ